MSTINPYYADSWGRKPFTQPYLKTNESIATKITNLLFPKNELTGRRTLKIIPNFLINGLGHLNYELACPFYKKLKDPELNRVVQSVFDKLVIQTQKAYPSTKNMSWKVRIKKDPTINTFCFSGGKIVITAGCIETLKVRIDKIHRISHEDLIASMLAHEMIHAIAEHICCRYTFRLIKGHYTKILHSSSTVAGQSCSSFTINHKGTISSISSTGRKDHKQILL